MADDSGITALITALRESRLSPEEVTQLLARIARDDSVSISSLLLERGVGSHLTDSPAIGSTVDYHALAEPSSSGTKQAADIAVDAVAPEQKDQSCLDDANATVVAVRQTIPKRAGFEWAFGNSFGSQKLIDGTERFRVEKEIGRGGLGCVYQVHDQHLGRDVAVKVMTGRQRATASGVSRFRAEAEITGQLEHPGIVPVYELGLDERGNPFYAMKLVRGRTLKDAIEEYHDLGPVAVNRPVLFAGLLRVFVDLCNAVAFAHSKGVIHRDLKPANVMLGDFGEAIVLDWGLAKPVRDQERASDDGAITSLAGVADTAQSEDGRTSVRVRSRSDETRAGTVAGTLGYMPPEQACGLIDQLDQRSDVFSLGAILYEMLTGRPPYVADDKSVLITLARSGDYPPPREVSPSVPRPLEAVSLKALSVLKDDRYETAKLLADEIVRWQAGEPVTAYPEPWYGRTRRWLRRHKTLGLSTATAAAACVLVATAFIGLEANRRKGIRAEIEGLYDKSFSAFAETNLDGAKTSIDQAAGVASAEPALTELAGRVGRLRAEIDAKIADQDARAAAKERMEKFQRARFDASFYATFFTGLPAANNFDRAREAINRGIEIASSAPSVEGHDGSARNDSYLSESDRRAIAEGLRDLHALRAMLIAESIRVQPQKQGTDGVRIEAGLADLDRAKALGLSKIALRIVRARLLEAAGDAAAANAEMEAAKSLEPDTPEDSFLLGFFHYASGDLASAMVHFGRVLQAAPGHFWAHYYFAVSLLFEERSQAITGNADRSANIRSAIAHFSSCLDELERFGRSDFEWIHVLRGYAFGLAAELPAAEADFAEALRRNPNSGAVYVNRGALRLSLDKLDAAERDFLKAVELQPNLCEAHLALAEIARRRRDLDSATMHIQKAASIDPGEPRVWLFFGKLRVEMGDLQAAIAPYGKAIELEKPFGSEKAATLRARGRIYLLLNKPEQAVADFEAAAKISPRDGMAAVLVGDALMRLGRFQDAKDLLDQKFEHDKPALDEAMTLAVGYRERGLARAALGEANGAFEDYDRALSVSWKPQTEYDKNRHALVLGRRGWSYLIRHAILAESDFVKAIEYASNQEAPKSLLADLHLGRGYSRAVQGRSSDATGDAETALRLAAEKPEPAVNYNAACVFAVAAEKVSDKSAASSAERELADRWTSRAISLLDQFLKAQPEAARQRRIESLASEPAFVGLRKTPAYQDLLRRHGAKPNPPSG